MALVRTRGDIQIAVAVKIRDGDDPVTEAVAPEGSIARFEHTLRR